jgi:hypothetical protein
VSLPQYQVRVVSNAYGLVNFVRHWKTLKYKLALNALGSATLTLHPDNDAIADIDLTRYLQIVRNGVHEFGGPIQRYDWTLPESTPASEAWNVYALDHGAYAQWRIVIPPPGDAYATYTDHAGDAMKDFVYNNLGAGAAVARQFADLAIEADGHQGTNTAYTARYETVLATLQRIAAGAGLDFRFVPSASGCTFQVAASWGLDRSQGNGVNAEAVFALDRRNFKSMKYQADALSHRNYVYVGGQDAGAARTIVERDDATAIAAYQRRETFVDGRNTNAATELQAIGDAALSAFGLTDSVSLQPFSDTWQAATGTTWDLGDTITCKVLNRFGRSWDVDARVTAINVSVAETGVETVTPTLEVV